MSRVAKSKSRKSRRIWSIRERKHLFFEILLILGAVLIFRSMWTLMDAVEFLTTPLSLGVMFVIGVFITLLAFKYLFVHEKEHNS